MSILQVAVDDVFVLPDGVTSFFVEDVFSDGFVGGSLGSAESPYIFDRYLEVSPEALVQMGMRRLVS